MPTVKCLNKSFHNKTFHYKGHYRGYCTVPDCIQDRKNKSSKKAQERNKGVYKTVHHLYRKKGEKQCATYFCTNTHNNRFGYCDTCRDRISDYYGPMYLQSAVGISRHNGVAMI